MTPARYSVIGRCHNRFDDLREMTYLVEYISDEIAQRYQMQKYRSMEIIPRYRGYKINGYYGIQKHRKFGEKFPGVFKEKRY